MKKLIVLGLLSFIISNCGADFLQQSKSSSGSKQAGMDPNQNSGELPPILGVNTQIPASYTFLDTPNANLCVDAFLRRGIALPDTTVARSLNVRAIRSEGIGISDLDASTIPVLNVVTLDSQCSNLLFQFYNPNGYYCIVKNTASYSNIRIQKSCAAKMAEIEPITVDSVNSGLNFWHFKTPVFKDQRATTGAYNSQISELPCVP